MSPSDPSPPARPHGSPSSSRQGVNGQAPARTVALAEAAAPPELPPALAAPPSLETAWHILRRRWQPLLALALPAALAAFGVVWYLVPGKYVASATVQLNARNPRSGYTEDAEFNNFQRTQAAAVKGNEVLTVLLARPEIAELSEVRKHQGEAYDWLQRELTVEPQGEILRVSLAGDNPDDLAKILNTLLADYEALFAGEEKAKLQFQIKSLRESITKAEADLKNDSRSADDAPGRDLRSLELKQSELQNKIFSLERDLRGYRAQIGRDGAEKARYEEKKKNPESLVQPFELAEKLEQDGEVRALREQMRPLDVQIADYRRLSPSPAEAERRVRPLLEQKAKLEQQIDVIRNRQNSSVRQLLQDKKLQELNEALARLDGSLASNTRDAKDCEAEIRAAEKQLTEVQAELLTKRRREEQQREALGSRAASLKSFTTELGNLETLDATRVPYTRVKVREQAQAPSARKNDRKLRYAAGAAAGALALVFLGVVLVEFGQRRVYAPDDVARGLGLPVLGTLPRLPPAGAGDAGARLAALEAADALRAVLLQASRQENVRVLMITSADVGEGKTTLACQLAASLARAGRRTLLLDAELRRPAAHAAFGLDPAPGFGEALRGEIDPDDAIRPTSVPNLLLLPAGQGDQAAIQALAQDEVQTLFFHLKEEFEFVVIDVAPVLPVADALVVGEYADAALLSVLRDVSRLPDVYAARQRLEALGVRLLGAVVSGGRAPVYAGRAPAFPAPARAPGEPAARPRTKAPTPPVGAPAAETKASFPEIGTAPVRAPSEQGRAATADADTSEGKVQLDLLCETSPMSEIYLPQTPTQPDLENAESPDRRSPPPPANGQ